MRLKNSHTRIGKNVVHATLVASLAVGLMAGSVFAAKPFGAGGGKPGGGGGSYSVTVSPSGPYTFGQSVYITTNAPIYPNNTGPWIWLKCYQNGVLVLTGDHAGFPEGWYYGWPFNLGPTQSWSSGAADCTVTVVHTSNNRVITDATTSFHVNG